MRTDDLNFDLPPELIAQTPTANRSASRLLHYHRQTGEIAHRQFDDLPQIIRRGDLLVFNDARVIPARLAFRKPTGGTIEGLFLSETQIGQWRVLLRDIGKALPGTVLHFERQPDLTATLVRSLGNGEHLIELSEKKSAIPLLDRVGRMPLPPYIKRGKTSDDRDDMDRDRYQTVYAAQAVAIAAPTAGLHFTPQLLQRLDDAGIERTSVTLHVGAGTFKPITTDDLQSHSMHSERWSITAVTAEAINRAKAENRRVIAVGTTSARVLESQHEGQKIAESSGETAIFIYPPYRWRHVDALITNFHLPRSTLIALVAAMTGLDRQRQIYRQAIEQKYRFFSYGDAMLIE